MEAFSRAYSEWRDRPFPPGSSDDAIDELHAQLVLADTWVAESVLPFVKDGRHVPATPDVIGELWRLRREADALAATASFEQARLFDSYRESIDALLRVYREFLAVA